MAEPSPELVAHYATELRVARQMARDEIERRARHIIRTSGRSARCTDAPDDAFLHSTCSGLWESEWPVGGSLGCLCECHDPRNDDPTLRAKLRDRDAWLAENDPQPLTRLDAGE